MDTCVHGGRLDIFWSNIHWPLALFRYFGKPNTIKKLSDTQGVLTMEASAHHHPQLHPLKKTLESGASHMFLVARQLEQAKCCLVSFTS